MQVPERQLSDYRVTYKPAPIIERPECGECKLDMWLLDIKRADLGQELRTFECARCGASKTLLCRSER
jgi:DNA-directed RNA polymerase subunit M/transcription elongation factor TFIIS